MLKVTEFYGDPYYVYKKHRYNSPKVIEMRDKYLRFEWDTGHLEIKESVWNKFSQKKKNMILKFAKI